MKLLLVDYHEGQGMDEKGLPIRLPIWPKGTRVKNMELMEGYLHWFACEINGYNTYVPDVYVKDGRLNLSYDATELALNKGEVVELVKILYEWFLVKTKSSTLGWLPASKLRSI